MLRDQDSYKTSPAADSPARISKGTAGLAMSSAMSKRVYHLLCRIPSGSVTTYGELGRALKTRGFQAIGRILNSNPHAPTVPCHRVVMKDGSLGGYAGGVEKKQALLTQEGVEIDDNRVLEFTSCFYSFSQEDERSSEALQE